MDTAGLITLGSNQISLPAGIWRTHFWAEAFATGLSQARLHNVTTGTTLVYGTNCTTNNALNASANSEGAGWFVLTSPAVLELQQRVGTSRATDGYGNAHSFGSPEVYAVVELWRESPTTGSFSTPAGSAGVLASRVFSRPTDNVTLTGDNTWRAWGTDWTLTVPNIVSGQYVLLRAMVSMSNASNYHGAAFYRVTGGSTFLFGSVTTAFGHITGTSIEYVDTTPGTGSIVYQIRGGGNTGTVALRDNADATFSIDKGNSIFVAEVYWP